MRSKRPEVLPVPNLRIRRAAPADALAVARVHVRSWQEGYRALLPAAFLEAMSVEERAQRYTFGGEDPAAPTTFVAEAEDSICGFATTLPARDADVAVGTLYRYFKDKGDLFVACADDYVARHRRDADEILASKAPADEKLRRYVLGRYRHCREVGTASLHAAELARAVLKARHERQMEEAQLMEQFLVAILTEGNGAGLFHFADTQRDARHSLVPRK